MSIVDLKINESELIENRKTRAKFLEKVNVLEKVKHLTTLPDTDLLTTRMVAEWFEVSQEVIRDNIRRNREELEENGLIFKSYNDIKELVNSENISQLKISRQGINVFSKRAVLNMAMLLRDSSVAKEVRNNLLDVYEAAPNEVKTANIDKEKAMLINIAFAESDEERMIALSKYREFKNQHVQKLRHTLNKQQPKIKEHEHYLSSKGLQDMNAVAKSLKVGRNHLFRFLREPEIKVMIKGKTVPYQTHIDRGWFTVSQSTKDGYTTTRAFVTPKGISGISQLIRKNIDKYDYMRKYKGRIYYQHEIKSK